ncbi:MAG: hypothetical protein R8K47_05630 [Mariprofundaceae bacterium]
MEATPDQALEARIEALETHLAHVRRNMEKLISENRRMREVVRLAESELRKRRDQVRALEGELQRLQNERLEAKARVENAIEKLDELMREKKEEAE